MNIYQKPVKTSQVNQVTTLWNQHITTTEPHHATNETCVLIDVPIRTA